METRRIKHADGHLIDLAFAYCMAKPWIWRCFFGWRKSTTTDCVFTLSKRAWRELENFIKENY